MNQNLIRFIEKHNGEVILTPYSAYVQMIAKRYLKKWIFEGNYLDILSSKALLSTVTRLEKGYQKVFGKILKTPRLNTMKAPKRSLQNTMSELNTRPSQWITF